MSTKTLCFLMVCSLHLFSSPAMAQDVEAPESQVAAEDAVDNAARSAREARDRGDYEAALKIIELAQVESPDDGLLIYERVLTLEAMGEEEIALNVIGENRDVLLRHSEVNDLAIVEQRLTDAVEKTNGTVSGGDAQVGGQVKGEGDPVVTQTETTGSDTPWLGWTAVAVGTAGLTIGTILLIVAEADAVELRCDDCGTGTAGRDITRQEFDDRKSSIRTRRIIGGVSIGIGTAALAYGLYEIFTHEPAAPDDSGVSFDVHRRGLGVTYTTTF